MKQNQKKFNSGDILVREHRNKVPQFLRIKEILSDERLNVIRLQVFMDEAASKFCEDGYVYLLPVLDWEIGSSYELRLNPENNWEIWNGVHVLCKIW